MTTIDAVRRLALVSAALVWALSAGAGEAFAQAEEPEWSCEAQEPILEAARTLAEESPERALDMWLSVVSRCGEAHSLRALYNVAWAKRKLGDPNGAVAGFTRFVELAEPSRGNSEELDRYLKNAKVALTEIRASHAELDAPALAGHRVIVTIDGEPAPAVPFRRLLPPGRHRIRILVDAGRAARSDTVTLVAGKSHSLVIPIPKPPPTPPPPPEPYPVLVVALLWSAAGALATAGAVAHGFAAHYDSKASDIAAQSNLTDAQHADHDALREKNARASVAAVIGYAAGAIVGGVALAITIREAQSPAEVQLQVSPHEFSFAVKF